MTSCNGSSAAVHSRNPFQSASAAAAVGAGIVMLRWWCRAHHLLQGAKEAGQLRVIDTASAWDVGRSYRCEAESLQLL